MKAKFTCGHFVKTTPNLKFVGNDLRVVPQKNTNGQSRRPVPTNVQEKSANAQKAR